MISDTIYAHTDLEDVDAIEMVGDPSWPRSPVGAAVDSLDDDAVVPCNVSETRSEKMHGVQGRSLCQGHPILTAQRALPCGSRIAGLDDIAILADHEYPRVVVVGGQVVDRRAWKCQRPREQKQHAHAACAFFPFCEFAGHMHAFQWQRAEHDPLD